MVRLQRVAQGCRVAGLQGWFACSVWRSAVSSMGSSAFRLAGGSSESASCV